MVGAIATQAPQCSLATAAMHELGKSKPFCVSEANPPVEVACTIFEIGKNNTRVIKIQVSLFYWNLLY